MSLINQVLKEVDKKKNKAVSGEQLTAGLTAPTLDESKRKQYAILLLIAFVVIALAVVIFLYIPKNTKSTTSKTESTVAPIPKISIQPTVNATSVTKTAALPTKVITSPKQPMASDSLVVEKTPAITLSNYEFKTDEKMGALSFVLSAKPHYTVTHSADNTKLVITLAGTKLSDDLPKFAANGWLQSIAFQQAQADVTISIDLQPNTELQKVLLQGRPKSILTVGFYNPKSQITDKMQKQMLPLTPEQQAQHHYQQALELIDENETQAAIAKLQGILKILPSYALARETLATLLYKNNQKWQADEVAMVGLTQDADNLVFVKIHAHILVEHGRLKQALELLQQHTPPILTDPGYYGFMAALYQRLGQYTIAAKLYNQLTQVESDNAIWWIGLGVALDSAGSKNAAIEAYQQALRYGDNLNPNVRAYVEAKINHTSE